MSVLIALHVLAVVVWVGGMFFAYMAVRPVAASLLEPAQRAATPAGRDTRWPLAVTFFGFLGVRLPLAYLLAIVCGLALYRNHTRFDDYAGVNQVEYVVATVAVALCAFRLIENAYRRFRLSRKVKDLTRHELVVSFAKFGLVGASGFLVDLGVFTLLNYLLSVPVEVTRGVAYWVAATWNWFFNRAFTFSEAEKVAHGAQWSKYLLMCLVSFFPNWGTFTALTRSSEFFAQYNQLALVAGVGAGMVFNFVGARFVIFKQGNSEPSV